MEMFFTIYFAGVYIAFIIYGLMLSSETFRDDFMSPAIEIVKSSVGCDSLHPYTIMTAIPFIITPFSWIGVVIMLTLAIVYFINYGKY